MDTFKPRLDILPAAQRQLLPELRPVQLQGYVLYGGTAIALRLGARSLHEPRPRECRRP